MYVDRQTQALPEASLRNWKWWKWPSIQNTHCEGCGAGIYDSCKCAENELPKEQNKGYPQQGSKAPLTPRAEWDNAVPDPYVVKWPVTVNLLPEKREYITENYGVKNTEYPDNNPKTAVGAKKIPLELVPPSAVHALAEAFSDGAKKYGPYNWRDKTISSSIYYSAALRHITAWWDGEDVALDSGVHHLHHAIACIAMLIDGKSVGKLNDNRPPKGVASEIQRKWVEKHG